MNVALRREVPAMALGTALSRVTGFARIFALAYALGFNPLSDSYNLANNTPNIIFDLVVGGILSATLIPVFVEKLTSGTKEQADYSMSAVITLAGVVLVLACLVVIALSPEIISLYTLGSHVAHIQQERIVATTLLRWFAPQIAFYGICTLVTAVLNSYRVFTPPMFVPILNNIVCIVMLIGVSVAYRHPSISYYHTHHGLIIALGLGTTAGVLAQTVALIPYLSKCGAQIRWVWDPRHESVQQVLSLSGWTFGFVIANQVAFFIVLALATHANHSAVTAYSYAYTFFQLPYGIVAVSVMSAIQPELAARFSEFDLAGLRKRLATGFRSICAIVIPAATGLLVLAQPIVALILGHGSATPSETLSTGGTLTMLAVGLPGFCTFLLLMRAFQAMQDTKSVFRLYLIENGINVVLALVLVGPMGVRGLALSISVAYTLAALIAAAELAVPLEGLDLWRVSRPIARVVLLSVLMGVVAYGAQGAVNSGSSLGILTKVAAGVFCGVSVYVAGSLSAAYLTKAHRVNR